MAFSGRLFPVPHHPASALVSSTGPLTDVRQPLRLLECCRLFPDDSDHHFPRLGIRDSVTHPTIYKRAPAGCHTCPFFFPSLTSQHSFVCTKPTWAEQGGAGSSPSTMPLKPTTMFSSLFWFVWYFSFGFLTPAPKRGPSTKMEHSGCFCYPQSPNETQLFQSVSAEIPNCWDQDICCQVPPPMPQLQTKIPAGLCVGTGGRFNSVFDWALCFFYLSSRPEILSPMSCNLLVRLTTDVFIWYPKFFISSFVSAWIFFRESTSTLISWMFFPVFIETFVHILFMVFKHMHDCCFEAFVLFS